MLFYGITTVQAGITLSILMVVLQMQDNRISIDELTGINNRKEMSSYIDKVISHGNATTISVMMIDVNKFKKINDDFGHNAGDEALKSIANALKKTCDKAGEHLFLCRYGGDEFVIIANDSNEDELNNIAKLIKNNVKSIKADYKLDVSIGYATKTCSSKNNFKQCLKQADQKMYIQKSKSY